MLDDFKYTREALLMNSPKFKWVVHDISAVQIVFKLGYHRTPWFVWLNNCTFLFFIRFVHEVQNAQFFKGWRVARAASRVVYVLVALLLTE